MSGRDGLRRGLLAAGVALLAACAQVPPEPSPPPAVRVAPQDGERDRAIARHRELARQAASAGDLAGAAAQWQILTAIAPGDETFRRELAGTRAAIERAVHADLAAGLAAAKRGDGDGATDAMLRVLALDPGNAQAAQVLRDIEHRHMARIQAGRAAKAGGTAMAAPASRRPAAKTAPAPATDPADAYALEQPLEMLAAGDTEGGLRDLRRFVDANPDDRAARHRIGAAVYDRAKELEADGRREDALELYQQAVSLRGGAAPGWTGRIRSLQRALGDEYVDKGVKAYPSDPALAVRLWQTSLRFDPQNAKAAARLRQARAAPDKGARSAN
jgi:tetratricopeptide (TPR) repeat protein